MPKEPIRYTEHFDKLCHALGHGGALLLSLDGKGKANPMTIGWGTVGIIWGRPIFVVLVRPSRYTHGCIEHTGDFTVNVPTAEMSETADFCGTVSGRDHDKMKERGLTEAPSQSVKSPGIAECAIIYECKVVQTTDVLPATFDPEVLKQFYPQGDFHRVYFGEIMRVVADPELVQKV